MARVMFGVESEYAIAGINGKAPIRRDELVSRLVAAARRRLAHLPDMCSPSGMFLENGARFYIDCGLHPEMTTPECTTPWELTRYIKAGERILEDLTQDLQTEAGAEAEVMCFRCNVDYSGSGSTWGCHESYLHRAHPASLPDQLIGHLVSRVVYTGAGGFNPLVKGLDFCVAPRLMHIEQAISGDSTGNRGIFHTKNESLSGNGDNRLHILCGESLCSETAIVLKIGATALVVAMAEAGLKPGVDVRLASPLEALHAVSTDVTCKRQLRLAGGSHVTAIEIQRQLLRLAERNRAALPPWADAICALWRRTLDQLENDPDSLATVLDWAIKLRLFRERAARCGVRWGSLPLLGSSVQRLSAALAGAGLKGVQLSVLLGPDSPISEEVARTGSVLAEGGMGWSDVERFLSLRDVFLQIDTRFGQLGPRGIFTALDRSGVLAHKVAGVDGIDAAMHEPPALGRAKLRGENVRRLSGKRGAGCSWMAVISHDGRTLNLRDPFATAEAWDNPPVPPAGAEALPPEASLEGLFEDPSRFQRMLDAMRGRHGRPRTRAQGSTETS